MKEDSPKKNEVVWKEGPRPAFLEPAVWEADIQRVQKLVDGQEPWQQRSLEEKRHAAQTSWNERGAWARLEATRVLCLAAPSLFPEALSEVLFRTENALVRLGAPPRQANLAATSYSHPPPRMPFLIPSKGIVVNPPFPHAGCAASAAPDDPRVRTREAFLFALANWPRTPGGRSVLQSLNISVSAFEEATSRAAVAVVPGFERNACYVCEPEWHALGVADVDAFFLAEVPDATPDTRTLSLWAHEAGHLAHGIALRTQGQSPFLTSDEEKETVALEAELLSLAGLDRASLRDAIAHGSRPALSAIATWWSGAHEAGGPYIPAAWNAWNDLKLRG